jgi:predicted nuclease of restriction endonuclease-like RecB superfamily
MLPSELLAVWKRKGEVMPKYAKPTPGALEAAATLIEAYQAHVGEKKKVLKAVVSGLEDEGYEYRFVRGLAFILDRRSLFKCTSKVNPIELRRRVFHAASTQGYPAKAEKRRQILLQVAAEAGMTPEAVDEYLYADLDSELTLEKFTPLTPHELLSAYNLSLTQTLLFDATELIFTAAGNWQNILHAVKKLGLIYEAERAGDFIFRITGPVSLFKLTKKYGTSLAKLLPHITASPFWQVEAKILWKYTNELCTFKADSRKHGALLKTESVDTQYDSTVEEDFALRFQALKSGWSLKREPEPVLAGKHVLIPDFSLEKHGVKVYVEIVGFWTAEYLKRKIEKLSKTEARILLLVNESLACEKLSALTKQGALEILYYTRRVPLNKVLQYLEQASQTVKSRQVELLKSLTIRFTEPVVAYEDFAAQTGLSPEAVREALTSKPPEGYVALHNAIISEEKLTQLTEQIDAAMAPTGKLPLPEAERIIEQEGIKDATSILEAAGYKIKWHGITAEKAEVHRASDHEK